MAIPDERAVLYKVLFDESDEIFIHIHPILEPESTTHAKVA